MTLSFGYWTQCGVIKPVILVPAYERLLVDPRCRSSIMIAIGCSFPMSAVGHPETSMQILRTSRQPSRAIKTREYVCSSLATSHTAVGELRPPRARSCHVVPARYQRADIRIMLYNWL